MDRWPMRAALLTAVAAAGLLHGAHVAVGMPASASFAPSAEAARTPQRYERDALRGSLWRPADSLAERQPTTGLEPSLWRPAGSRASSALAARDPRE